MLGRSAGDSVYVAIASLRNQLVKVELNFRNMHRMTMDMLMAANMMRQPQPK